MRADRITDRIGYHLEGAIWWPTMGRLRLVDMLHGDVLTLHDDDVERTPTGSAIAACLRPREFGGAVIAREHDVVVTDADDLADPRVIATFASDPQVRGNEGGCDAQGSFYIGTMAYDQRPGGGALYRIDPGEPSGVATVLPQVTVSNGIAWTAGGERAYYNDSGEGTVSVLERGEWREFRRFGEAEGSPDGCSVDTEGGVWIAMNGAGEVRRFAPDGELTEVIEVGARQVTSCTFGGEGLGTLFITTSRENLDDDDEPAAGSVFAVEPGIAGLSPYVFLG